MERHRLCGDLTELLKLVKGMNKGDFDKVIILKIGVMTHSNGYKLDKFWLRKEIGNN